MYRSGWLSRGLALVCALCALALASCQGSNSSFANPRPRSREAAGTNEELPGAGDTSNRAPVDSSGGELAYKQAKLTIPVGALPETIFLELELPSEPPQDVLPESAYQINPDALELQKEALLTISYYDEDIPEGRTEADLVIVHQVSGVWVELSNSQVHEHNNIVQAPINFLGLYALRARTLDSRTMNAPPVASFEFSEEPFEGMASKPFATARQEMEDKEAAAKAQAEAKAKGEDEAGAEGEGEAGTGEAGPGAEGGAEGAVTPPPNAADDQTRQAPSGLQGLVTERRVVGGPDSPGRGQAQGEAGQRFQEQGRQRRRQVRAEEEATGAEKARGQDRGW